MLPKRIDCLVLTIGLFVCSQDNLTVTVVNPRGFSHKETFCLFIHRRK